MAGLAALLLELYCIKNLVNLPVINMDALFYYSAAAYGALHGSWLVEEGWKKERTDRKKRKQREQSESDAWNRGSAF